MDTGSGKMWKKPQVQVAAEKEEASVESSNQTLEDLKAIDEDIEKLRKQIEERDKIISALREAAEAKDKKLDNFMLEFSKLQPNGKLDVEVAREPNRAASSSPSSPPLCSGELCWADSFASKNYHEPVYAQLLNDHAALQKVYNDLRTKLQIKGEEFERLNADSKKEDVKMENHENAITLIMAEQIRVLKEREAQLIWEAEELREQNDLMEFRILELEECRKEFLDKETNEGKQRVEKIVWRERDLEEISDSGVVSLPTSEDLTSDSELGDAVRNFCPSSAVSVPAASSADPGEVKTKKFKSSECLQESGIFVDSEIGQECVTNAPLKISKGCQTESFLDKALLDIIDSSYDLFLSKNPGCVRGKFLQQKSGDLSTEISKLSVIQERIRQKTNSPTSKGPHTIFDCPHSNSVLFYEERLSQLEDKLKIYESSGETKEILLAKRLQKEVDLAHRVKELVEKVASLEATNKRLEEEKCEFEEAENDTRFQCQRLEVRLQELIDKNAELELELERQKVMMTEEQRREKKKESLEGLINQYEQRSFELEEKEVEARQRLSLMEAAMPGIVAWNVFRMSQSSEFGNFLPGTETTDTKNQTSDQKSSYPDSDMFQRLEELLEEQKKLRKEYEIKEESAADRERILREKIEELEGKAAKDREMLEEMTNSLKAFKQETKLEREVESSNGVRPEEVDLFEELKQMIANEIQLRTKIERLEKKEQAYMQSLEKADEIWARMEADYKRRLKEAEVTNANLQRRIAHLEAAQQQLEKALATQPISEVDPSKINNEVQSKIEKLILENDNLKMEITRSLDAKFEEHKKFLEVENTSLREEVKKMKDAVLREEKKYESLEKELESAKVEAERQREVAERLRREAEDKNLNVTTMERKLQSQITDLTQELNQKSKELSSLEVTVAELREEVETLEGKVSELVETIQTTMSNQEALVSRPSSSKHESGQWSLPVEESVRHVVSVNIPSKETVGRGTQAAGASEFVSDEVFLPLRSDFRPAVPPSPLLLRQEMRCVFPRSEFVREMLPKSPQHLLESFVLLLPSPSSYEGENTLRNEEIFQLSLTNTKLQQTLERMEEESRLKDKELEELLKIALEILKEQTALESAYELNNQTKPTKSENREEKETNTDTTREEPEVSRLPMDTRRTSDSDGLPITDPKTTRPVHVPLSSLSTFQIGTDNLKNKSKVKNVQMLPLKQKGDCRDFGDASDLPEPEFDEGKMTPLEGRPDDGVINVEGSSGEPKITSELLKPRPSTPKLLGKSSSVTDSLLLHPGFPKTIFRKTLEVDPEFSFVAPIRIVRRVGDDGIFLEWDVTHQPDAVTGFEIKVNGLLSHRVRSSSRNKALLRPLNLSDKINIQVFALSENGRSVRCSQVSYPDEHLLLTRQSERIL